MVVKTDGTPALPTSATDTVTRSSEDDQDLTVARHTIFKTATFWIGCSFTMLNINLGILGPWLFSLSLTSATLAGLTGIALGTIPTAMIACLGPSSGLNTMVLTRFFMGRYPTKLICVLSVITILGYGVLEAIAAGNMLAALFPASRFSERLVVAGVAVLSTLFAMTRVKTLHDFERWVWIPQLLAIFILIGASARNYSSLLSSPQRGLTGDIVDGIAFCALVFADAISYATTATDLFVHYPPTISRWRVFLGTLLGMWVSLSFLLLVGIGLGSGARTIPSWREACLRSPAVLITTAYEPLGTIGIVCCIVLGLGAIGPTAAGIYSNALALQASWTPMHRLPHSVLVAVCGTSVLVCAVAANDRLAVAMGNIVSYAGYWGSPWLAIFAGDYMWRSGDYLWSEWKPEAGYLPRGTPASISFVVGITVALLSAAQSWMVGPIAKAIDPRAIDLACFIAPVVTFPTFVALRYAFSHERLRHWI